MNNIEIIKKAANEYAKYIGGNAGWDYENSRIEGLFCQGTSISFYLYVLHKYKIEIDIIGGLFLIDNDEGFIHYWCEYNGLIIDFTCSQFISEIEELGLRNEIKYGSYLFEREYMNIYGLYIIQYTDKEKILKQYKNEYNLFNNKIIKNSDNNILKSLFN